MSDLPPDHQPTEDPALDNPADEAPDAPPLAERSAVPPTLSIIIPTLNAATDLGRALDSLSGGGIDFEVIVADGGSTDGTQRIARAFDAKVIAAPRGLSLIHI